MRISDWSSDVCSSDLGWVGPSVFKDEGAVVRYFDDSMHLCDLIMEAWEIEEPGKRWAVMEYTVTGTSFDVKFKYPEEIDPAETEVERRPAALTAQSGDTPEIGRAHVCTPVTNAH